MNSRLAEKLTFVASLAALAWLYGYATHAAGWFPTDFLVRAQAQARALWTPESPPEWTEVAVYDSDGVSVPEPSETESGLTLIASHWARFDWRPGLVLIDRNGDVVHEWRIDPSEIFADSMDLRPKRDVPFERRQIHGFHLFDDGDVLVNVENVGTARLDACGEVRWALPVGSHHSISPAADESFWISTSTRTTAIESLPRSEMFADLGPSVYSDSVDQDRATRISGDGRVLDEISMLHVLFSNGLERHIRKASRKHSSDLLHLNDVEPLRPSQADEYPLFEAGDLLISLRNLDLVFVLDPHSEEIRWHASHPFIQQHDPDYLGRGWIGVFDNNADGTTRGTLLGGSRIVALRPHTGQREVLFPTATSDSFYTEFMGDWQRLDGGNLLLTESVAGRVVEVSADGRTVWEWVHGGYGESRVPWVTGSERPTLGVERAESWPCPPASGGAAETGSRMGEGERRHP